MEAPVGVVCKVPITVLTTVDSVIAPVAKSITLPVMVGVKAPTKMSVRAFLVITALRAWTIFVVAEITRSNIVIFTCHVVCTTA